MEGNYIENGNCKRHGKFNGENCPYCTAYFWEQEQKRLRRYLFDIKYVLIEQIPDVEVVEKIESIIGRCFD